MAIPVFRGSKGEDPEVFLREYKKACIGTGLRTAVEWLLFPNFKLASNQTKIQNVFFNYFYYKTY
jgi:hypothetical protein